MNVLIKSRDMWSEMSLSDIKTHKDQSSVLWLLHKEEEIRKSTNPNPYENKVSISTIGEKIDIFA